MASNILTAREINDLLLGTFDDYGDASFTNIAADLQRYEFMPALLKDDRIMLDSGIGIKRTLMTKFDDVAKWIGFHEATDVKITDHLAQLDLPWKHLQTHWAFDAKELMMNKGKALIVNVIKPRETGALLAMADTMEKAAWDFPATTDEKTMYGIPYYVVWNSGNGGGFNGTVPSGYTTVAGINPDVHTNYRNYTEDYTLFTPGDWLDKARKLHLLTYFMSPVSVDDFRGEIGERFRIYTTEVGMRGIWRLADQHNENIGWDFGHMDHQTTFKGNAFRYVSQLDTGNKAASSGLPTDPFYFIDRHAFLLASLSEDHMRRTEALNDRSTPDSYVTYINLSVALLFLNRRACGVMGAV